MKGDLEAAILLCCSSQGVTLPTVSLNESLPCSEIAPGHPAMAVKFIRFIEPRCEWYHGDWEYCMP